MRLSFVELKAWAESGGLVPFSPECLNPASIDLRWSGKYKLAMYGGWSQEMMGETLVVIRGAFYLLDTMETITVPDNWAGTIALKSSLGRQGLDHLHAGFFDPGFHGTATLEIENRAPWPITITKGQRLIQLVLDELKSVPERTYQHTGHYQNQRGPTEAR